MCPGRAQPQKKRRTEKGQGPPGAPRGNPGIGRKRPVSSPGTAKAPHAKKGRGCAFPYFLRRMRAFLTIRCAQTILKGPGGREKPRQVKYT